MGVDGQRHAPAALPPEKRPGIHFIGGCVGPRADLDGCGKSPPPHSPLPGFDPRTVQPVASSYTYWAIPAHKLTYIDDTNKPWVINYLQFAVINVKDN